MWMEKQNNYQIQPDIFCLLVFVCLCVFFISTQVFLCRVLLVLEKSWGKLDTKKTKTQSNIPPCSILSVWNIPFQKRKINGVDFLISSSVAALMAESSDVFMRVFCVTTKKDPIFEARVFERLTVLA